MELINGTKMQAGYTMGMDSDGREYVVVAIKGTYQLTPEGGVPKLAEQQAELVLADEFTGEPGLSAPLYEIDYSPIKHQCDVLLNGSAYAPKGQSVPRIDVGLAIGSIKKTFEVVGNRIWVADKLGYNASPPQNFTQMPIGYDNAYGGTDDTVPDKNQAYMKNPIGQGYQYHTAAKHLNKKPLPNTQQKKHPIKSPLGKYQPMAFGSIGRHWEPRYKYAGTYDDAWMEDTFPFLPKDFNEAYFQAAPADQQMPYPSGGERISLLNLSPHNKVVHIELPKLDMPVVFFKRDYQREHKQAVVDTILIEPDRNRMMLTWRTRLALKKNMFEVPQIVVGEMSRAWWRARDLGKTYHGSLADAVHRNNNPDEDDD